MDRHNPAAQESAAIGDAVEEVGASSGIDLGGTGRAVVRRHESDQSSPLTEEHTGPHSLGGADIATGRARYASSHAEECPPDDAAS